MNPKNHVNLKKGDKVRITKEFKRRIQHQNRFKKDIGIINQIKYTTMEKCPYCKSDNTSYAMLSNDLMKWGVYLCLLQKIK